MPRLYSYILSVDAGSAPNPFRGMCTLAICKPKIRSSAKEGDWIAGVGSCDAPSGDLTGHLVYAMKVEKVVTLAEYDTRAANEWPHRIPDVTSLDMSARLGDCIYQNFRAGDADQRRGVHGDEHKAKDLSGKNVLISRDFYYFGSRAIKLPEHLLQICKVGRGHRSIANQDLLPHFESWIRSRELQVGQLYGWPDYVVDWSKFGGARGCIPEPEDDGDEEC